MAIINGDHNPNNLNDDNAVGGKSIVGTAENDIIHGLLGNDNIFGNGGAHDELFGDEGNDFINGSDGGNHLLDGGRDNDQLFGANGNDTLEGGIGNDLMQGGAGDDTYFVDSISDSVIEFANQGNDIVNSTISFTLPDSVEKLKLAGVADIDGVGNNLANTITGNAGRNTIKGGGGNDSLDGNDNADRLTGNAGDDTLAGGRGLDGVIEEGNVNFTLTNTSLSGNGTDTLNSIEFAQLTGGSDNNILDTTKFDLGDVTLFGRAGNDTLKTGKGNDTLRGEAGDDIMNGGDGIDTYFVDSTNDQVIEASATGGSDSVFSTVSFTLGANVENLTLGGSTTNTNGTGNALDNTIAGDANRNTLKGLDGKDTLTGGLGNDILIGGNGSDTISGNGGNDRFVFDTGAAFNNTAIGLDSIKDFINFGLEDDRLVLDKTTFTALKSVAGNGFSVGSEFVVVSSDSAAATSSALITYNQGAGALYYNQNGAAAGFGTGGQFASLSTHPNLSTADFVIQA